MCRRIYLAALLLLISFCVNACALDFSIKKKDGSVQDAEVVDGQDWDVSLDVDIFDLPVDEAEPFV